jgi:hypothetical protein
MASFLDNTGDIILDAVLTDYGRQLLAKGDGSFNIVKFALGDDEIDYSKWDSTAVTTLKDQKILLTPIMEAFTNNAASLKNKLLTIGIENLLYLPILKLQTKIFNVADFNSKFTGFLIPIDDSNNTTRNQFTGSYSETGLLNYSKLITVDQGLDSSDLSKDRSLANELPEIYETEYNIMIDNRLGTIASTIGGASIPYVSVDDDNMATYKVSLGVGNGFVSQINPVNNNSDIAGYKGTRLTFTIKPTLAIESDSVLDRLGEELELVTSPASVTFKTVKSFVRITGVTTGYSIELPLLFAKKKT